MGDRIAFTGQRNDLSDNADDLALRGWLGREGHSRHDHALADRRPALQVALDEGVGDDAHGPAGADVGIGKGASGKHGDAERREIAG